MSSADGAETSGQPSGIARRLGGSLWRRLAGWFIATSFLLVLITTAILYWAIVAAMNWADDQVLEKRMNSVAVVLQSLPIDDGQIGHELTEDIEGPRRIYIRAFAPGAGIDLETPDMGKDLGRDVFPDVSKAPRGTLLRATVNTTSGASYRVLAVRVAAGDPAKGGEGIIQLAADRTLDENRLSWFKRLLAMVLTCVLPLCIAAGYWIVNRELKPLSAIGDAAAKINSETLNYRVSSAGLPIELQNLAEQFNSMLARLESAYANLSEYADNIAHEIRTPLNKMVLGCEVALAQATTTADYRDSLEAALDEGQQLTRLVQGILFLARAERGNSVITRQPVALAKELETIRAFFEASAEEAGITLTVDCRPATTITGDATLVQRAVSNLVANAIAHTPAGGRISISAALRDDGRVAVTVRDNGEGIAPEHQGRLFDRFYRAAPARRDSDSLTGDGRTGLGLAITKSIMTLHLGAIELQSAPGQGTAIALVFPPPTARVSALRG